MKNTARRIGKFKIRLSLFDDHLEEIMEIFSLLKIVPVRAEVLYEDNNMHYTALSPFFDGIKEGNTIPLYNILMTKEKGKIASAKFEKEKY